MKPETQADAEHDLGELIVGELVYMKPRLLRLGDGVCIPLDKVSRAYLEREDTLHIYIGNGERFVTYDADVIKSFFAVWEVI